MSRARSRVVGCAAFAVVLLALAGCGEDAPKPTGFNGRFRGTVGQGDNEITLTQSGDVVKLAIDGNEVEGRLVSPTRAEGSRTDPEGTFRFALDIQGNDRISATFGIEAGGQRLDFPPTILERVVESAAPATAAGPREGALVGHWRHTEVLGSGGSHLVTDTHFVFAADGTFETWSKSAGMGTESETPRSGGAWKTVGDALHLRPDGEDWTDVGRYALSGDNLMITSGGAKRVFERL